MVKQRIRSIVHINTLDTPGGAARIASMLHGFFRQKGYDSKLIVGRKLGNDSDTIELRAAIKNSAKKLPSRVRLFRLLLLICRALKRRMEMLIGIEDLGNPASRSLEEILPDDTDIILCHNLHGGYFDLSILPELSKRYTVVLLMHDPWLLAGHCAHSFDCEKWIDGCFKCPYLDIQYKVKRDTAHINWLRKKRIYDSCRIYVITPSHWLMNKVNNSILKSAVIKSRVINNGVDQKIFFPADKSFIRTQLGISVEERVVMFAANGIRESIWKDYTTMRAAVCDAALALPDKRLRFIAVGEHAPDEQIGLATINFVSYKTSEEMAKYYQAADLYIHAACAENFPNTVIEALSCGTPVIATAVGGVPEQIKGLRYEGDTSGLNHYGLEDATGILTPLGNISALSSAIQYVFNNPEVLKLLSVSAKRDASLRFNLEDISCQYIQFFEEVVLDRKNSIPGGNVNIT